MDSSALTGSSDIQIQELWGSHLLHHVDWQTEKEKEAEPREKKAENTACVLEDLQDLPFWIPVLPETPESGRQTISFRSFSHFA